MYIRQWHHPWPNDLCGVEGWHVALASVQGRYEPGDAEFPSAAAILAANHGNISLILRARIHLKVDLRNIADAVYSFSLHQYWIHPNGDLLDSLLSNCRTQLDVSSSGRCTQLLGDILRLQDRYEESLLNLEEALSKFISVGDERGHHGIRHWGLGPLQALEQVNSQSLVLSYNPKCRRGSRAQDQQISKNEFFLHFQ